MGSRGAADNIGKIPISCSCYGKRRYDALACAESLRDVEGSVWIAARHTYPALVITGQETTRR